MQRESCPVTDVYRRAPSGETNVGLRLFRNVFDRLRLHARMIILNFLSKMHYKVKTKILNLKQEDIPFFLHTVAQECVDTYATALIVSDVNDDSVDVAGMNHIATIKRLLKEMNFSSH